LKSEPVTERALRASGALGYMAATSSAIIICEGG
jgi:hypothetical protein